MQIQLKQSDLEKAVHAYVGELGISRPVGKVTFTATRSGDSGIITEVEILDPGDTVDVSDTVEKAPVKAARPPRKKVVVKDAEPKAAESTVADLKASIGASEKAMGEEQPAESEAADETQGESEDTAADEPVTEKKSLFG